MNTKYTDDFIIATANGCASRADWKRKHVRIYEAALRRGLLDQIYAKLPPDDRFSYSIAELKADAARFESRKDWLDAGLAESATGVPSHYHCAYRMGVVDECCAHMEHQRKPITDEEILSSALKHQHKAHWKHGNKSAYSAALNRKDSDIFERATAHMIAQANPYSGKYLVYSYEFQDGTVYVGLTYKPEQRKAQHLHKGPVCNKIAEGLIPEYKVLIQSIKSPDEAGIEEAAWIASYRAAGWALLNRGVAGGLGTIKAKKWTREACIEEAKKFATRKTWAVGNQLSYVTARANGWFEEAAAHMPRRVKVPATITLESISANAVTFPSYRDWHRAKHSEHVIASRCGWLPTIKALFPNP